MNDIINKFLLAGDKFLSEMHLKQPGFTYSAGGPFTKNRQRMQKFMETGDTRYIYRNELDKVCFGDLWLIETIETKKEEHNQIKSKIKAFKISSNLKYDGHQRGLSSMVYKIFGKKSKGAGIKK